MVLMMIAIGGITRLTKSGLSIVEWKPITGILPPITHNQWSQELDKYKQTPEYQKVNNDISLQDFKTIFLIEYIHRVIARLLLFVVAIPCIVMYFKRYFDRKYLIKILCIILLIPAQGLLGWYMVKSGLINNPEVSHYRLTAHLMLAVAIYMLFYWRIIRFDHDFLAKTHIRTSTLQDGINIGHALVALLLVQIAFGGLVAGLKAGLIYNTFPMMGNQFIPDEISWLNFDDPVFLQFIHRCTAYAIFLFTILACINLYKRQNYLWMWLMFATLAQIALGILTVLLFVPIAVAVFHQITAMLLLSICIKASVCLSKDRFA